LRFITTTVTLAFEPNRHIKWVRDLNLEPVLVEKVDMVIDCFVLPGTPRGTVMQSNALLEDVGLRGDISLVEAY